MLNLSYSLLNQERCTNALFQLLVLLEAWHELINHIPTLPLISPTLSLKNEWSSYLFSLFHFSTQTESLRGVLWLNCVVGVYEKSLTNLEPLVNWYVYLSQNWDSNGHFEVLNKSKFQLVQRLWQKTKRCKYLFLYKIAKKKKGNICVLHHNFSTNHK